MGLGFLLLGEVIIWWLLGGYNRYLLSRLVRNRLLMAVILWPGTFLHEVSHLLMALFLSVRVGEVRLWPRISELPLPSRPLRLGYVKIAKVDPVRNALIGLAPLLVGLVVNVTVVYRVIVKILDLYGKVSIVSWLAMLVGWGIISFSLNLQMHLSRSDVRFLPVVLVLVVLVVLWQYKWLDDQVVGLLSSQAKLADRLSELILRSVAALGWVIGLLIITAILLWLLKLFLPKMARRR